MKIKIMFPKRMDKSDVQIYMDHGALSDAEKKKLKEHLDDVCKLIHNPKIGYRGADNKSLISIEKNEKCLYVEIDDALSRICEDGNEN